MGNMQKRSPIKLIVWDLDGTLWNGILLEPEPVRLKPGIMEVIRTLDARGILHSIASRNDRRQALAKLREFGLDAYFLCPEINWNAKSVSVENIRRRLNIGMDAVLFIDDQRFEREEVRFAHSAITCLPAACYPTLPKRSRLNPHFVTTDSASRRLLYQTDLRRARREKAFAGSPEAFLASLDLQCHLAPAAENDLQRAEELTVRTHQLNSTGIPYRFDRLQAFRRSGDHLVLLCELTDRFGSYGKIGLALIRLSPTHLHLKLLLTSCRVMSRGIGAILLACIMRMAQHGGKGLTADFRKTDRNRLMYMTFKFAGFREKNCRPDGSLVLENDLSAVPALPPYIQLTGFGCESTDQHNKYP